MSKDLSKPDDQVPRRGSPGRESVRLRNINADKATATTLVIPIKVNRTIVNAVIDSAAEVTVMSNEFASKLRKPAHYNGSVRLQGALGEQDAIAKCARNISIQIADDTVSWDVYVADICEDFILGVDFLLHFGTKIDLSDYTFLFKNKVIPVKICRTNSMEYRVSRVIAARKYVVPPETALRIKCKLDAPFENEYSLQPNRKFTKVLIPNTVHSPSGSELELVVINDTRRYATVKKDQLLGHASEVDILEPGSDDVKDKEEDTTPPDLLDYGPDDDSSSSEDEDDYETRSRTPRIRKLMKEEPDKERVSMKAEELHQLPAQLKSLNENDELPGHVQGLYDRSINNLDYDERSALKALLIEYQDVFSRGDDDLGQFKEMKFKINTGDADPVQHRLRRTPVGFEGEEEAHLLKMLDNGIIRPSSSEWASSPVLVRKKDNTVRYCLDYRDLNAKTVKDRWPLPSIQSCLDTLHGNQWFSTLDLASGYWQFEIEEEDIPKTAFLTKFGLFEHVRMAFGLTNAPSFCQRAVELVLRGMTWKEVLAYLDDVIILGKNVTDHMERLRRVFERFREHNLKVKPKKCELFQTKVPFLGRIVSQEGISVDPDKVKAVHKYPVPQNTRQVERFLGFANYHRDFIENFASKAECLYQLTGSKPFEWSPDHMAAFEQLKEALTSTPVLAYPSPNDQFILDTDASSTAIAAELSQIQDGRERTICYGSLSLTPQQRNYCTTRRELLAIVMFTRQFRHYLLGRRIIIRTDNGSLLWLMRFKNPAGQLARWLEELSQYDFQLLHRKGKLHVNADVLSRIPDTDDFCPFYKGDIQLEDLPCGGCRYCTRAQTNWASFEENVDDVVPLARPASHEDHEDVESSLPFAKVRSVGISSNWMVNRTGEEMHDLQMEDDDLKPILKWISEKREPDEGEFFICSKVTKFFWQNKDLLTVNDGVLYYKWVTLNGDKQLIVIPSKLRDECLELAHDNVTSGHYGQHGTFKRLIASVFWKGMRQDTTKYVQRCHECSVNKKPSRKSRYSLRSYHAGYPMERVHLDILGPLDETVSGNRYILVMVDQFTKWVELEALPEQTAELTAKAAVNRFFTCLGCPSVIHTDQGRNFDSNLFKSLCKSLQIAKSRTTAYRPASNGQVERYNRTILQILRCMKEKGFDQWDQNLQIVACAMRSAVNRQTGFTPNLMMLGREANLPLNLMMGCSTSAKSDPLTYVQKLEDVMKCAHETARNCLKAALMRQKDVYDQKLCVRSYEEGDLVLLIECASKIGQCSKLSRIWKGPFQVTDVISPYLYRIRGQHRQTVVHHDRLKPYRGRELPEWMATDTAGPLAEGDDEDLGLNALFDESKASTRKKRSKLPEATEDDLDIPEPQVTTRTGRSVKAPHHLRDYALD